MLRGACGRVSDGAVSNFLTGVNPDEGMNESYQIFMAFLTANARALSKHGQAPTTTELDAHMHKMAETRPLFYLLLAWGRGVEALLGSQNAIRWNDFDTCFDLKTHHQLIYLLDHGYKSDPQTLAP